MPTFKIYTLGCKVNQYDSQVLRENLESAGLKEIAFRDSKTADYCLINTCTVTAKADAQSRYAVRLALKENPKARIVVTGCLIESEEDKILKIDRNILAVKNKDKNKIINQIIDVKNFSLTTHHSSLITYFKGRTRAFVKVQDGCDNFCSFCKVPYVRGRSRSRNKQEILDEIKVLRDKGYKEIVLTGICLGDYGKGQLVKEGLVDLIEGIEEIEGILRIRLSSIEAKDVTDALIAKLKASKKLCPHLHIPFQSGDNDILCLMKRRDTQESYLQLAEKLKNKIKNINITTDIIVGFPGESEENFNNTVSFLKSVGPGKVHIFPFDLREGTALAKSDYKNNKIPIETIKRRCDYMQKVSQDLSLNFKKRYLGSCLEVLIEEKNKGCWQGYSKNYLLVCLNNEDLSESGKGSCKDKTLDIKNVLVNLEVNKVSCEVLCANLVKGSAF